ncbi:MAG: hypothetical protein J6D03_10800 [Clostridia bacterium]|nr:hypothetical protein [Clostridia bacterium]
MKYLDLVKKIQNDKVNDGHIVLIKNGIFFIGIGKDAIILNRLLKLKLICMKENMCKVGFQTRSIEKYIRELKKINKNFVIYNYNRDTQREEEIIRFCGEKIYENKQCLNCKECNNRKETENEIIERVKNSATI